MRLYPSYIDFQNSADNNCMEILLSKIMHERNLTVRQVEQMTKVPKSTINDIRMENHHGWTHWSSWQRD